MPISTTAGAPEPESARERSIATIAAISVVAFAIANVIHEGAGHGGACVVQGGAPLVWSTVHFDCSIETNFIAAAGTLANFAAALLFWLALRRFRTDNGTAAYFAWLSMTVNLFDATGYFLFSGVSGIGDWAVVIHGYQPAWLWRTALSGGGMSAYVLAVWWTLHELRPLLPQRDLHRGGAKDVTIIPYVAGGTLFTVAGLFNPVGMMLVAISAAASSFGGTSGLAWMTQYLRVKPGTNAGHVGVALPRSPTWIASACVVAIVFIAVLGRGVRF